MPKRHQLDLYHATTIACPTCEGTAWHVVQPPDAATQFYLRCATRPCDVYLGVFRRPQAIAVLHAVIPPGADGVAAAAAGITTSDAVATREDGE